MADPKSALSFADRHELELRIGSELERLPGVVTAAAWIGDGGRLRDARIHILPGAAPTIIANAASRVLQALNIAFEPVDIRITTIALPDEIDVVSPTATGGSRVLLLHDIDLHRSGSHVTCAVQLVRQGAMNTGEARELDTESGRARAAALATLHAAEASGENLALGLEGIAISEYFGRRYAIVSVEAAIGRRVATLSGIVPIDPSRAAEEAVCLATLRAIDRWIGS